MELTYTCGMSVLWHRGLDTMEEIRGCGILFLEVGNITELFLSFSAYILTSRGTLCMYDPLDPANYQRAETFTTLSCNNLNRHRYNMRSTGIKWIRID